MKKTISDFFISTIAILIIIHCFLMCGCAVVKLTNRTNQPNTLAEEPEYYPKFDIFLYGYAMEYKLKVKKLLDNVPDDSCTTKKFAESK